LSGKASLTLVLLGLSALRPIAAPAQELAAKSDSLSTTTTSNNQIMSEALAGAKNAEHALYLYERIERVETRKEASDPVPQSIRIARVVPAGTGLTRITLGPDAKPTTADAYRAELTKLLNSLTWAAQTGAQQREAYQKIQKKQKDRDDLIEATRTAFIYTFLDREPRGDRILSKYRMEPNPSFKSTNRATSIFAKVRGFVWVDDSSHELARVEGEVTEDISLGLFIAKVYKGSHFMQERYEMAPGLWLPSFTQYDFDGRKFFSNFGVHEKTFYSSYKKVGTPAEAIPLIRAEIAQLDTARPNSADVQ
jgi:hypothetical protein